MSSDLVYRAFVKSFLGNAKAFKGQFGGILISSTIRVDGVTTKGESRFCGTSSYFNPKTRAHLRSSEFVLLTVV